MTNSSNNSNGRVASGETRAYSYIRFSTPEQSKGDSLRRQTDASLAYCQRNGLTLDESLKLHDLGISAFKGKNAEAGALAAFLSAVEQGRVTKGSTLIVESLDRLSRNAIEEAVELVLGIVRSGIRLVTLNPEQVYEKGQLDFAKLVIALAVMSRANEESSMKSYRGKQVWKSKLANIANRKMTGKCPSWLRLSDDKKTFHIIEANAAIVRRIFKEAVDGNGAWSIARSLNRDGVRNIGYAKTWSHGNVFKLLVNPAVHGAYTPYQQSGNPRPTIQSYFPAVVSESDFNKAQFAIANRRCKGGRRDGVNGVTSLISGLAYDASDGASMVIAQKAISKDRKTGTYLVSSAARAGIKGSKYIAMPYGAIEQAVLRAIEEIDPKSFGEDKTSTESELEARRGKIAGVEARIEKIAKMLLEADTPETYTRVLGQLETQKRDIELEIEALTMKASTPAKDELGNAQELIDLLGKTTGKELKELRIKLQGKIRAIIDRVNILVVCKNRTMRRAYIQMIYKAGGYRTAVAQMEKGKLIFVVASFKIDDKATFEAEDLTKAEVQEQFKAIPLSLITVKPTRCPGPDGFFPCPAAP